MPRESHHSRYPRRSDSVCIRDCPLEAREIGGHGQALDMGCGDEGTGGGRFRLEVVHRLSASRAALSVKPVLTHHSRQMTRS